MKESANPMAAVGADHTQARLGGRLFDGFAQIAVHGTRLHLATIR